MRRKIVGAIIAIVSTSAFATAANDFIGVLSNQVETKMILVKDNSLKCDLYQNERGYIPYDWSQVKLVTSIFPDPIFAHLSVTRFSDSYPGSAEALCDLVTQVKSQADDAGYVNAQIRVKADVKLSPRYAGACGRDLQEEVTVTFSNGLVLTSRQERTLSNGTAQQRGCGGQF